MTKKERILSTALQLFADEGFKGVATAKIAREAKVSEGLIFRHFKNKKGLLDAITKDLEEKVNELIVPVMEDKNPTSVLRKAIIGLLDIPETDYTLWRLQFKLKATIQNTPHHIIQGYIAHLSWAFSELNYPYPNLEGKLLFEIMDTTFKQIVQGELENKETFITFLLEKYDLAIKT